MARATKHQQNTLHRAIDEVLHYLWDPIGVAGCVQARDEYYSYVDHVYTLLQQGADVVKLSRHLHGLETQAMGMSGNPDRADSAARKLLEWRDALAR